MSPDLLDWGWVDDFGGHGESSLAPGRITTEHRREYRVVSATGEGAAIAPGKMFRGDRASRPVVGDWVLLDTSKGERAVIREVLPRRTLFSRKAAGEKAVEQPVAANMDEVWIFADLSAPINLARLERFVAVALSSGAMPRLMLSKADLVDDGEALAAPVRARFPVIATHVFCSITGVGLDAVREVCSPRKTVALLGPSGVGKSTLINVLAGEELMAVGAVREGDRKGRHTTTHRALLKLPNGCLVIDTPGMRELALWDAEEGIAQSFGDIDALTGQCRFRDCHHDQEPGCAVRDALESGAIDAARLVSYLKLVAEQEAHRWR